MARLGLSKQEVVDKYRQSVVESRSGLEPSIVHQYTLIERILHFLIDLGLPMPFWKFVADPVKRVFRREGVIAVPSKTGTTPGEVDLTFCSRQKGALVLNSCEIGLESIAAMDAVTMQYLFDGRANSIDVSQNPGAERGYWKFDKIVLKDGECLTIRILNHSPFAQALVGIDVQGWEV